MTVGLLTVPSGSMKKVMRTTPWTPASRRRCGYSGIGAASTFTGASPTKETTGIALVNEVSAACRDGGGLEPTPEDGGTFFVAQPS
jgi:hypothetical protein